MWELRLPHIPAREQPVHPILHRARSADVPQPLVQRKPAVLVLQREVVGRHHHRGAGVWPTQQPVPAIGEHAHPHAVVPRGLVQVVVQLPDVLGVGVAARRRADAPLHLDEGVQRRQVHRPARPFGGRILLDDLLARGQSGRDEEVPHRAGDVGLRLEVVVPPQHLPRGLSILRVVYIDLRSHARVPVVLTAGELYQNGSSTGCYSLCTCWRGREEAL